jgi:hypothetical protein
MMQRVLGMFRRGYDTVGISDILEIREASVERILHAALAADREAKNIIKNGEGHA